MRGGCCPVSETELCRSVRAASPLEFPHLVLVLCAGEGRLILEGSSAVPAFLSLQSNSSISAVPTRHICALRKGILFCGREITRALKFHFRSLNAAFSSVWVGGACLYSVRLRKARYLSAKKLTRTKLNNLRNLCSAFFYNYKIPQQKFLKSVHVPLQKSLLM